MVASKGLNKNNLEGIANLLLYVMSAIALISFLYVSLSRFTYPFDIVWDESMVLDNVWRVYDGQPIYLEPSKEFAPSLYAPLYYYLCAGVWKITGPCFWSARLISIISTLIIAFFIFLILRWLKLELPLSVAASGLFLFLFSKLGQYYDLARTDMLTLAFFGGAVYYGLKHGRRFVIAAGILAALSCLTKQNFIILSLTIPIYYVLYKRWKDSLLYIATLSILLGGVLLLLHLKTSGWSSYLMLTIPSKYLVAYTWSTFWELIVYDFNTLFIYLLPIIFILLLLTYYAIIRKIEINKELIYFSVMFVGALIQAMNNRLHYGSWLNQYIPLVMLLIILLNLAISRSREEPQEEKPDMQDEGIGKRQVDLSRKTVISGFVIIQLILLLITAEFFIPSKQDYKNAESLKQTLKSLQKLGPTLMTYHGFFSRYYSGKTTMHIMALSVYEFLYKGNKLTPLQPVIIEDIINSKYYAAIIIDTLPDGIIWNKDPFRAYQTELFKNYTVVSKINNPPRSPITLFEPKFLLIRTDLLDKAASMGLIQKQDGNK